MSKYIEHYNTKRLHSALYYLTPEYLLLGQVEERERKYARARLTRRADARQQAWQPLKPVAERGVAEEDQNLRIVNEHEPVAM